MLYSAFLLKVVVDLNNQMLSVVIHAGYEGGDISEEEYITHVNDFVLFFCKYRYIYDLHESSTLAFHCLYLHLSLRNS